MNKKKIKIAMGQLLIEGGEPERNLRRAEKMIKSAAKENSDLLLLPETIDFAWTHPSAIREALPIPGEYSDKLCRMARDYAIYLCVGLTKRKKDGRLFNTALLIDDFGKIILEYHKINLLEVEQPIYDVGNVLRVADTEFGRIGVNICADNYFDSVHIAKTLASMGAQIILSPSSWTVDYNITEDKDPYSEKWLKPLKYLARMYNIVMVSTTSVGYIVGGPYEGKKMVGCSLAVDTTGILKQGQFNEFAGEIIYLEIQIPQNKEQGISLNKKILERGFKPEITLWETQN